MVAWNGAGWGTPAPKRVMSAMYETQRRGRYMVAGPAEVKASRTAEKVSPSERRALRPM